MPSATDIKNYDVSNKPSAFISPFSDRPPVALYSSLTIKGSNDDDCLPCAITSLNRTELQKFLIQLAEEKIIVPQNSTTTSTEGPVIPDPPPGAVETKIAEFLTSLNSAVYLRPASFERYTSSVAKIFWVFNSPAAGTTITGYSVQYSGDQVQFDWGDGNVPIPVNSGQAYNKSF